MTRYLVIMTNLQAGDRLLNTSTQLSSFYMNLNIITCSYIEVILGYYIKARAFKFQYIPCKVAIL